MKQEEYWSTHLANIAQQDLTHLGLCEDSVISTENIYIDADNTGTSIMLRHPWPAYITKALVLNTNPGGGITNSNLEFSALAPHKATLL